MEIAISIKDWLFKPIKGLFFYETSQKILVSLAGKFKAINLYYGRRSPSRIDPKFSTNEIYKIDSIQCSVEVILYL